MHAGFLFQIPLLDYQNCQSGVINHEIGVSLIMQNRWIYT